ncbi:SNF2 family N-terminal domain-containing protein [Blakeslea trispora]|nr:SNF2 family N-terminal domain-containing protein [Blakeslea trispora]
MSDGNNNFYWLTVPNHVAYYRRSSPPNTAAPPLYFQLWNIKNINSFFFLSFHIMSVITGATGKTQALFEFLDRLQEDLLETERDKQRKKIKLENGTPALVTSPTLHHEHKVEFPFKLDDVDMATQKQLASELSNYQHQSLLVKGHYTSLDDCRFGSLQIFLKLDQSSGPLLLVEKECMVMPNEFREQDTERIDSEPQLLMALVFAMHTKQIEATRIQLTSSYQQNTPLCLSISFDRSAGSNQKTPFMKALSKKLGFTPPLPVTPQLRKTDPPAPPMDAKDQASTSKQPTPEPAQDRTSNASPPVQPSLSIPVTLADYDPTCTVSPPSLTNIPSHHSVESFLSYLQPPVSNTVSSNYLSPSIRARLTPFQSQNVEWMMAREAHYADDKGLVQPDNNIFSHLPLLYAGSHIDRERGNYPNVLTDKVMTSRLEISKLIRKSFRGGILADEMGLGKTVSVLALIAKHKLNKLDPFHPQKEDDDLLISPSTLIIAPGPIISQWCSEIEKHAPKLSYFVYQGRRVHPDMDRNNLLQYDIVLTHYEAFKHEIYYTKPLPKRPQRSGVSYKRKYQMSPLVSICWFRCILDEAQMIEAGLSHVSAVAKLIPSWYRWAVTGTPVKNDLSQLYSLYDFLELETTLIRPQQFNRLSKDLQHRSHFYQFAKATIRRNLKAELKGQIHIPPQSHHVVHIPFSTVEQHYYEDLWRDCQSVLRLDWFDSIGWTLPEDASESTAQTYHSLRLKMRQWLLALRQACIHPSMITNATMRLGYQPTGYNSKKIQSMDQVLEHMSHSAKEQLDNNQYAYYNNQLKRGGMYECLQSWSKALSLYESQLVSVEQLVSSYRRLKSNLSDLSEIEKNNVVRQTFRWQMLLHRFYFYAAGVCHVLEKQTQEEVYYEKASQLRQSLMESHTARVLELMQELERIIYRVELKDDYLLGAREFDVGLLDQVEYEDDPTHDSDSDNPQNLEESDNESMGPGLSQRASDINTLENVKGLGDVLDRQFQKILYLRQQIIPLLNKPLVDNQSETEKVTGDEYESSLIEQEMCQVYLSAYQYLLEDRRFIIRGSTVNTHDTVPTEGLMMMSDEAKSIERVEKAFRNQLKSPGFEVECIKDVESELRALKQRLNRDHATFYRLVDIEHQHIVSRLSHQHKLIDYLEGDFKKMNQLFNSRIAYYKYLQMISDTLMAWSHDHPQEEIEKLDVALEKLKEKIAQGKSRTLYFKTLLEEQTSLNNRESKECLICQDTFEKGIMTYCGHVCCLDCGAKWFKTSQKCHTCNSPVRINEWYTISYRRTEIHQKDDPTVINTTANSDTDQVKTANLMKDIEKQCIIEGQGAKLDAIVRHIKYIKTVKGEKCVVFSQWTKVLEMLKKGLKTNGINFIGLNTSAALNRNNVTKFQNDPDMDVILLHARSQSSGLTLVAAHTVFIVEPVLNTSLEKQAISRVHRIGQTKETHVFWYIVQDTIEERIQEVKRDHSGNQVLSTIADGGGEFVSNEDIQKCFTK